MGRLNKKVLKGIKDQGIFASSLYLEQHAGLFKFLENTSPHKYSQIMDEVYNKTYIGGGFHRHFDGSHTIKGSYDVIKDKVGEVDPSQFVEAHFRDFVTPEGTPILTLDKVQYEQLSNDISETLGGHINPADIRAYHRDINSFNAGEFCAAGIGSIFLIAALRSGDATSISRVTAANLCCGIASANPMQVLLGVYGLAHGIYVGKIKAYDMLRGSAPVIMGYIGYNAANKLFNFSKGGCIIFSIGTAIASNMLLDHLEQKKKKAILKELGEENPHYITCMTSNILKEEFMKLSRKFSPLGLGKNI